MLGEKRGRQEVENLSCNETQDAVETSSATLNGKFWGLNWANCNCQIGLQLSLFCIVAHALK